METDYQKLDEELNKHAIDIVYDILDKYSNYLSDEEKDTLIDKIVNNRVIIVDKPCKKDEIFFQGAIPAAHGPRTKKDGYIHIYPYIYTNLSTDEIISRYIEHIITHELYHYIIKLDIKGNYSEDEINFGHYITEGMVQLFTEKHNNKIDNTSNYRKNVDSAKIILDACSKNPSLIFQSNYKEIFTQFPELSTVYENYLKEQKFVVGLNIFLTEIAPKLSWEPKVLIKKSKLYGIDETLINLKALIESKMEPKEAKEYSTRLDNIYLSTFEKKKKSLI